MPTGPTRNSQVQKVAIRIDEVDLANRVVHGYDKTKVLIVATFRDTPAGVLAVPDQNERWLAERSGMGQWHLTTRLDSADDQAWAEANLSPGATRLSANEVHIQGTTGVFVHDLPTENPGVPGQLWSDNGVLSIVFSIPGTFTQPGRARLQKNLSKTQSGVANISITGIGTFTQVGVARVAKSVPFTQNAIARIALVNHFTQSGVANILSATAPTLDHPDFFKRSEAVPYLFGKHGTMNADVFTRGETIGLFEGTVSSANNSKSQPGVARITKTGITKTQTAVANIASGVHTKTQTGVARVAHSETKTQSGVANIGLAASLDLPSFFHREAVPYLLGKQTTKNSAGFHRGEDVGVLT